MNIFICCAALEGCEFIEVIHMFGVSSGTDVYKSFDFSFLSDTKPDSEGIHGHILCARCQLVLQITQEAHLNIFTSLT